jgi:hypothetical protein
VYAFFHADALDVHDARPGVVVADFERTCEHPVVVYAVYVLEILKVFALSALQVQKNWQRNLFRGDGKECDIGVRILTFQGIDEVAPDRLEREF